MSVANRLVSRFKAEFAAKLVSAVAGAGLMVVLARLLDPDGFGLLFLAISVFSVATLFSKLGIAKSASRYVAEYKETNPDQLPHILSVSFALNILTIAIVAVAFLFGHELIASAIGEPDLVPFFLVGALFIAFTTLVTYVRLVLQGLERIRLAAAFHTMDRLCRLAFAVGFVLLGFGALGALAGYIVSSVLVALSGLAFIYFRLYRPAEPGSIEPGLVRRIGEYSIPLTFTNTANVLDKRIDTVLVGVFLTPAAVSFYVVSKQIVSFIETPVSALGFTLSPTYGSEKASGNLDRAARIYETALVHSLLLYLPAAAGLFLVAGPTVELVFGTEFSGAVPVLQVLCLYAVLQSVTKITSNGLDFLGRARDRAVAKGVTAVLNVGLNVLLIPTIGVVGAAVATVITYSLYTAANVYIIHQEFGLRLGFIAGRVMMILSITAGMAAIVFLAVGHVSGPLSLAAVVLLGVVVWGVLSLFTGLLDANELRSTVTQP